LTSSHNKFELELPIQRMEDSK